MNFKDKAIVKALIIEQLERDHELLFKAAKTAHEIATDKNNIPDNKYDTLSLEASYIAQGQANRSQQIRQDLDVYQKLTLQIFDERSPIGLTSLIMLEAGNGEQKRVFMGPCAA
ncbi:MAG: hypothetical protein HQM11_19905 [SAR324 cluster bacterium]|nr:hypothetical protein [SAR324 cluster bacterium]